MQYYSAVRKAKLSSHKKTWENLTYTWLRKRGQTERLHTRIPTLRHSRKVNTTRSKNFSGVQELRQGMREGRRDVQVEHRGLLGQQTILYENVMVDM